MKIGIVSGYFNPIHQGHIEYINGAKQNCDALIVIVNNDEQVDRKGAIPFMDEYHRYVIVSSIRCVSSVIISRDYDSTVCNTIKHIKAAHPKDELIFFNSGDRIDGNLNNEEVTVCKELGIEFKILDLPKVYSSTQLLKDAAVEIFRKAI